MPTSGLELQKYDDFGRCQQMQPKILSVAIPPLLCKSPAKRSRPGSCNHYQASLYRNTKAQWPYCWTTPILKCIRQVIFNKEVQTSYSNAAL
jgi:hypothetical protein